MTPEQIEEAARRDPDARPLAPADLKRMRRTPHVKIIRRALGLTQEEFAARYRVPIGTLRDLGSSREADRRTHRARSARAPISPSSRAIRKLCGGRWR